MCVCVCVCVCVHVCVVAFSYAITQNCFREQFTCKTSKYFGVMPLDEWK